MLVNGSTTTSPKELFPASIPTLESVAAEERTSQMMIGFGLMLATIMILCIGVVLIYFSILRENQMFWTNAGGYPILLRDLVEWTYLPLLFGTSFVLLGLSMASLSKICSSLRFFLVESVMLLLCWGILAISGFIAFKNNITNILNGAPLHQHDKSASKP